MKRGVTPHIPGGVLFTNENSQVIFADQHLRNILNHPSSWSISWEPLHQFLGLDANAASQMVTNIAAAGRVSNQPLELRDTSGRPVAVTYTGVAVYDDDGEFIGADIKLWTRTAPSAPEAAQGGDVLTASVAKANHANAALRWYFAAQMGALDELLMRMGGLKFRNSLARTINEAAQRNDWPVSLADGQVEMDAESPQTEIFQGLLAMAVSYATRLFGESIVEREMQAVDEGMDAETLELATRSGLRGHFDAVA